MDSLEHEYRSLSPLQARIETHRRFSEKPDDPEQAVIDAVAIGPTASVLDVGCGTGTFLKRLLADVPSRSVVGLDSSAAAVASLKEAGIRGVCAEAERLPFVDEQFDVVTARHMLYHVDGLNSALGEACRVLKQGGTFVAVVNDPETTPRLSDLARRSAEACGIIPPPLVITRVHSFNLPEMLESVFGNVAVTRYENALLLPTPDSVAIYAIAILSFYGVPDDSPVRPAVEQHVIDEAERWFRDHEGPWRDPKGYVVCTSCRKTRRCTAAPRTN